MPRLVSERIKKLRDEIAEISEANRTQMHRRDGGAAADQERRLQRLQEILDQLMTLTDWKKDLNTTPVPYFHAGQDTPSAKA